MINERVASPVLTLTLGTQQTHLGAGGVGLAVRVAAASEPDVIA